MKLKDLKAIIAAELLTSETDLENEVLKACSADLMSDVLRFAKEGVVLITGLVNLQTLRTAEMADIKYVVFVRDKSPTEDLLNEAKELGIGIFKTAHPMYETCGLLYKNGLGQV